MNDKTHSNLEIIPEVGLTEIEGHPRARDIDVGERLGFERPRDIRKLIERNLEELEGFGPCATVARLVKSNAIEEYWLNEEQVLLVAALSNAQNAASVRAMLIRVFVAWRRGHLEPLPANVAESIRRTDGISRMLSHKVTEMEKVLAEIARVVQPAQPIIIRRGRTAGEIWHAAGYPPIKITNWFGNRLAKFGCQIDGRGELGLMRARLFDPDKSEQWLKEGGGDLLVRQKIAERQGQAVLRLVPGKAVP